MIALDRKRVLPRIYLSVRAGPSGGLVVLGNTHGTGKKLMLAWRTPSLHVGWSSGASWSPRDGGHIDGKRVLRLGANR